MQLNTEQRQAAESTAALLRVVAPPGSGKTRLLVERIKHHLDDGYSPEEILVITFTRAAALEIIDRLPEGCHVRTSTVHGYAHRIVQRYTELLGLRRPVSVLDEDDVAEIVTMLLEERKPTLSKKRAMDLAFGSRKPAKRVEWRFIEWFEGFMRRNNALRYDDLIDCATHIIKNDRARDIEQRYARVVLWDEFQDSSAEEMQLLELIAPESLTIVGDPEQAIYEWRGASPEFLLEERQGMQTVQLVKNYRSDVAIVEDTKTLTVIHDDMEAVSEEPGTVEDITAERLVEIAAEASNMAIMCRTNRQATIMYDLVTEAIPGASVQLLGKNHGVWATPVAKRFVILLKAYIGPRDSWRVELLDEQDRQTVEKMRVLAMSGEERLKVTLARMMILVRGLAVSANRLHEIPDDLAEELRKFRTIADWYEWYTTKRTQDAVRSDAAIQIMTIHTAKGLEWDDAVTVGMSQNYKTDEERRLDFVARSRPRHRLYTLLREDQR